MLRPVFSVWFALNNIAHTLWYRLWFGSMGSQTQILGSIKVYEPDNITIGNHSTVNHGTVLNARAPLLIGSHCHISPMVIINTGTLDITGSDCRARTHVERPVTIHDGVWVGSGAIINPGVQIGEGAVIAAGAVVTRDVAPHTLVAGVPARLLRHLASGS